MLQVCLAHLALRFVRHLLDGSLQGDSGGWLNVCLCVCAAY